jgi:hypothetical protein
MAFKVMSEPKMPRLEDVDLGAAHWTAELAKARAKMLQAEDGRARRRYMERIGFCEVAEYQAKRRG